MGLLCVRLETPEVFIYRRRPKVRMVCGRWAFCTGRVKVWWHRRRSFCVRTPAHRDVDGSQGEERAQYL